MCGTFIRLSAFMFFGVGRCNLSPIFFNPYCPPLQGGLTITPALLISGCGIGRKITYSI